MPWNEICEGLETFSESLVLLGPVLLVAGEKLNWPGAFDSATFFLPLPSQFNRML